MRILVVGAGVAGSTAAYWLARAGHEVTVVERAAGQRSSGSPVDVRGPALPVVERMGLLPRLREAATLATGIAAVDRRGRRIGRLPLSRKEGAVEIPRGDLATILASAAEVEIVHDESVTALASDAGGVDVTFELGATGRFDLVVGADGLHSRVRALTVGPEADLVEHLGLYVATVPLAGPAPAPDTVEMHNSPGRMVAVHPARGRGIAAFIWRSPRIADLERHDPDRQRRIVTAAYAGGGWRIPELLDRLQTAEDLYLDAVARVSLPRWSTGRIVLLGDAASCVTLLGDGSSMAIAGAATLAEALDAQHDVPAALAAYEREHRRRSDPRVRGADRAAGMLVPSSSGGLAARNAGLRVAALAA